MTEPNQLTRASIAQLAGLAGSASVASMRGVFAAKSRMDVINSDQLSRLCRDLRSGLPEGSEHGQSAFPEGMQWFGPGEDAARCQAGSGARKYAQLFFRGGRRRKVCRPLSTCGWNARTCPDTDKVSRYVPLISPNPTGWGRLGIVRIQV
ncbi:hypothetical protein LY76DRAFT_303805 [Colletotrichum caudatum]|nr:hypothetical protein LY76DRAFT_303805 [Colletotrichum caudatum]